MESFPPPDFPFRLEGKIGEGAMGSVYRAMDLDLNRRLAVKVMRPDLGQTPEENSEGRRRFLQEARAAAALSHPGIGTIYRIGEAGGQPYIAMEWLEGETLESILRRRAPLPVAEVARLGVELAEALDAAHAAGVVHRDVKPANLMILKDGRLKVMDFGIARLDGSDLVKTRAGDVLATPMYAAPEQLTGQSVDGRADIFSAGILLYLALTGRPAFAGRNLVELSTAILYTNPVAPHELNPAVPPALSVVILRALQKDRTRRFARARDLAAELRGFLAAAPSASGSGTGAPFPEALTSAGTLKTVAAPSTLQAPVTALTGLPASPVSMVARVVGLWPEKRLPASSVPELLSRLLEFPIHAAPFAGAVRIGTDALLLLHDGWILAALDLAGSRGPDEVMETLPREADAVLHPLPADLPPKVIALLATLVAPAAVRRQRHTDLDSTFVNLPALARKLQEEEFCGVLTLRRNADCGAVFFEGGTACLTLFSDGWHEAPLDRPWESWVSDVAVKASVEEPAFHPVYDSYRRLLASYEVRVDEVAAPAPDAGGRKLTSSILGSSKKLGLSRSPASHRLVATDTRTGPPQRVRAEAFANDTAGRFLTYLLDELPAAVERRGKTAGLKYLVEWIPLVRKALLHHELPRPQSRETDFFDLVTTDAEGKVLHLAHRVAQGTPEALRTFIERVTAAKTARLKTGDVGGALLVAPSFDESAAEVYRAATTREGETSRFLFGAIEAATSYDGFVRIGARRGFHLVLVAETAHGFDVLLP